jgi:hypothetical protein
MSEEYSVPSKDADFDAHYHRVVEYMLARVLAASPKWTHIPKPEAEALAADYGVWHAAWEAVLVPHVPSVTAAKNDARGHSEKVLSEFKTRYLLFPPVTKEDQIEMGMHIHDRIPTPVPKPEGIPMVEVLMPKPRMLRFRFKGVTNKRWGKPPHVHGMELVWLIADAPPAEVGDLVHSEFATKSPLDLVFKESERGERLYYAVRWETLAMKKGDYSEIYSVVIP